MGAGLLLLAVTALPIIPGNDWWIRIWDFPRPQIAAMLAATLFPLLVMLCHKPSAGARQEPPLPEPDDRRDVRRAIEEGREEAREQE